MTLSLLVSGDFVTTGGMDRANHALASFLARQGDEVHLVAHRVAADLLAYPNVIFHRVPKPANSYFLADPLLDRAGRHWARKFSASGGRVIVNGGNCRWGDVNWVHYVHAAYTPTVVGSLPRRIKARWSNRMFLAAERQSLQAARYVIANSVRTKQDLIQRVGVPEDRIRVVYYGTDPKTFYPATPLERSTIRTELGWPREKSIVVFVGALGDRRKGFDTLFAAWPQIARATGGSAMLVVVGAGAELTAWQRRIDESAEKMDVLLLGRRDDVGRILRAADLLISPTRYEAFGLGVQEALCCGVPAIVTETAGVAELYDHRLDELRLQNPDDATELASRVLAWWTTRDMIADAAGRLSEVLRQRTWDDMAGEIMQRIGSIDPPAQPGVRSYAN